LTSGRHILNDSKIYNHFSIKIKKLCFTEGKTGVPFVDANMRELAATGFMSNRGRQVGLCVFTCVMWWDFENYVVNVCMLSCRTLTGVLCFIENCYMQFDWFI
jgi:hypothetical protein